MEVVGKQVIEYKIMIQFKSKSIIQEWKTLNYSECELFCFKLSVINTAPCVSWYQYFVSSPPPNNYLKSWYIEREHQR